MPMPRDAILVTNKGSLVLHAIVPVIFRANQGLETDDRCALGQQATKFC